MSDSNSEVIRAISHYQQCLEKYSRKDNIPRMLHCIEKLQKLPVTVTHLEETGVGRTVNSLRKNGSEVGDFAKALVAKWKEMVVEGENNECPNVSDQKETSHSDEEKKAVKDKKHKSSSSHKHSDKKEKYTASVNKEKSSSSRHSDVNGKHAYEKNKSEKDDKAKYQKKIEEIKTAKYENKKEHESRDKHKSSKRKEVSSSEDESDDTSKHKTAKPQSKRKRSPSSSEEEVEERHLKHRQHPKEERHRSESVSEQEYEEEIVPKKKEHSYRDLESKEKVKHSHKHSHREKKEKASKNVDESVISKSQSSHKHKEKHESREKRETDNKNKDKCTHVDKKSKESTSSKLESKSHKSKNSNGKTIISTRIYENGIDSGSGASFAEVLGMLGPSSSKSSKKKVTTVHLSPEKNHSPCSSPPDNISTVPPLLAAPKLEPLDINISSLLPEITPNYRPISNHLDTYARNRILNEDEALNAVMSSKTQRTKVYSGNKMAYGYVPSLFDLCTRVLQDNIDALEYTGGVPFIILKPVLDRATPDQLYMLEHHNPYLIEDTDELWHLHCQKEFRNKRREEMETWRDMYMRCLDEREAKLKALTANIKQSQEKSIPVRHTKLAYVDSVVKPPRSIARKQAKNGTAKVPSVTPSSRLSAIATAGAAGQVAVPNPGARAASSGNSSNAMAKIKKAPLMQKTLALIKRRFRR